jgi:preprotein translocase subunit SecE
MTTLLSVLGLVAVLALLLWVMATLKKRGW